MDGLCLVAAPCNASWVIMVITQPSEARPEAPGMTRSDRRAWDEERWRLKGGGGVKVKRAGLSRCYPINPCCHIRGRWMYVDIPTNLSSSTIKMLMSDDDKCFSSSVICAALTDRRLVADGQKIEKDKGQNVLAEYHHFPKLQSTSLYSLYRLTACRLTTVSRMMNN
ncbi:hypothetical protein F7725_019546 [Dissostichus mawsoni]|uniref:Uncharacterized protein n=1 Tax=Dissostichus mawsoni TaxID=36200 RepID=A0A7J5YN05_DISMA|nr:hypothetical protein F7725_019546 [Dissostichus mawsoni]